MGQVGCVNYYILQRRAMCVVQVQGTADINISSNILLKLMII